MYAEVYVLRPGGFSSMGLVQHGLSPGGFAYVLGVVKLVVGKVVCGCLWIW